MGHWIFKRLKAYTGAAHVISLPFTSGFYVLINFIMLCRKAGDAQTEIWKIKTCIAYYFSVSPILRASTFMVININPVR